MMMALAIAFASAVSTRARDFKVETAKLRVTSPSRISGTYDVAIANFGRTLYGASLSGRWARGECSDASFPAVDSAPQFALRAWD